MRDAGAEATGAGGRFPAYVTSVAALIVLLVVVLSSSTPALGVSVGAAFAGAPTVGSSSSPHGGTRASASAPASLARDSVPTATLNGVRQRAQLVPAGSPSPTSSCGGSAVADAACRAAEASLAPAHPAGAAPATWHLVCSCGPGGREGASMVYDAADGYVVLYGGLYDATDAMTGGDTWTYANGVWTNITATACPSGCPSSRFDASMAYDAADGYVVLFGGTTPDYAIYADTWEFLGGAWSELYPTNAPADRFSAPMTYDAKDGYVVLFGGAEEYSIMTDTWEFLGGQWSEISASGGPGGRYTSGIAYDAADGYVLLYGGINSGGTYLAQTWRYVAGSWAELSPATDPGALGFIGYLMAYDTTLGEVLLSDGDTGSGCQGTTWAFSAGTWAQQAPAASPTAQAAGVLADDPGGSTVVEYSGYQCASETDSQDTWEYAGPLVATLSAAPNPSDVTVPVTFTGTASGGLPTYSYTLRFGDGGSASALPSSHAYSAPGTYTVWLWVNDSIASSATTSVTVTINPLPTATASATPNPTDVGVAVAFTGGGSGGTGALAYAWKFGNGLSSATQSPSTTYTAPGIFVAREWVNDTVGGSGSAALTITVNPRPSVTVKVTPGEADVGLPIYLNATATGGTPTLNVAWRFGDGLGGTGADQVHPYAAAGNYTAWVWANDSLTPPVVATATASVAVYKDLSPLTVGAVPDPVDVGVPVVFSSSFWGGAAPYNTSWRFADGAAAWTAAPSHAFSAPGVYNVTLFLNDSGGGHERAVQKVTVVPDPTVALAAAPATIDVGMSFSLTATGTGGLTPYRYAYTDLPTGCSSVNSTTLSCVSTAVFNGTVNVTLTDALGRLATAGAPLVIHADPTFVAVSASPRNVTQGGSIKFSASAQGGTGALTYNWSGFPGGCVSFTGPQGECTSASSTGSYVVHVRVTDGLGREANGSVEVQVTATTSFFGSSASSSWLWLILIVVALAAVGLFLVYRHRKRQPPTGFPEDAYAAGGVAVAGAVGAGGEAYGGEAMAPSPEGVVAYPEGPMLNSDGFPVETPPGPPQVMYTSDGFPVEVVHGTPGDVAPGPPVEGSGMAPGPAPAAPMSPPVPATETAVSELPDASLPPPVVAEVPRAAPEAPPTSAEGLSGTPPPLASSPPPWTEGAPAPTPSPVPVPSAPAPEAASAPSPPGESSEPVRHCLICGHPMDRASCTVCGWTP